MVLASFAYDPAGRLAAATDPMGRTTRYTYYGDNLLAQVIASNVRLNGATVGRDVVTESRMYDGAGNLKQLTTGGGKTTTGYGYDTAGRRTSVTLDAAGLARRVDYTLDSGGNVLREARQAAGSATVEATDFTYDASGRLTSTSVENGSADLITTLARDQRGLVTSVVDPRGNSAGATASAYRTDCVYDVLGRLIQQDDPPVAVERGGGAPTTMRPRTQVGYNTFGDQSHHRDPEGRVVTSTYDRAGRRTGWQLPPYTAPGGTSPINPTVGYAYDAAGRLRTVTDALGNQTSHTYDQFDRLVKTLDPPAATGAARGAWIREYDHAGEVLAEVDPTGVRTEATYDDLGRQITGTVMERRPTAANLITRYTYDDAGGLTTLTSPDNSSRTTVTNAAGEPTSVTDELNHTTTIDHDLAGRVTRVTDPLGNAVTTAYDLVGRQTVSRDLDAAGTVLRSRTLGYDLAGNLTSSVSARGNSTSYTFDALNRQVAMVEPIAAGQSITTTFGYDSAGARTRYTDGRGNPTLTTYNSLGLAESVVLPATSAHPGTSDRTWTTSYDANGQSVKEVQPGGVQVTSVFDNLGRVTAQTGTGAEVTTTPASFGYDLSGRLTSFSTTGGSVLASYNDRSQPLTITSPGTQAPWTASFTYDNRGRLTGRADLNGTTVYGYDSANRLTAVTDPLTTTTQARTYDDASRLVGVNYGAGKPTRSFGYDNLSRLTSDAVKNSTGTVLQSVTYGYDPDDNLTTKSTTGVPGGGANAYAYDQSGRLTRWTSPGGAVTDYSWDASGNRTQVGASVYTYDQRNRLTSGAGVTYNYTPRGTLASQTIGGATTPLSFDAFGRLVTDGGTSYSYDALGRVASRTSGATSVNSVYSSLGNDPTGLAAGAAITARYTRAPDGALLGLSENGTTALAITDKHDDLVGLVTTAAGGTLAGSASYDPFGTPTYGAGSRAGLGYQGEWTDPASGRVNMHARWYTPGTGGFASQDTMMVDPNPSAAANRYAYANADPLGNTDPTGHFVPPPAPPPVTAVAGAYAAVIVGGFGVGYFIGNKILGPPVVWGLKKIVPQWPRHYSYHTWGFGHPPCLCGGRANSSSSDWARLVRQNAQAAQRFWRDWNAGARAAAKFWSDWNAGARAAAKFWSDWNAGAKAAQEFWDAWNAGIEGPSANGSAPGGPGGAGGRTLDPRKSLIVDTAMTPHPRPPTQPGISQGQLDRIRDAAERGVEPSLGVQAGPTGGEPTFTVVESKAHATSPAAIPGAAEGGAGSTGKPPPPAPPSSPDPDEDGNEEDDDSGSADDRRPVDAGGRAGNQEAQEGIADAAKRRAELLRAPGQLGKQLNRMTGQPSDSGSPYGSDAAAGHDPYTPFAVLAVIVIRRGKIVFKKIRDRWPFGVRGPP